MDDVIITGDDTVEITRVESFLRKAFEVRNLSQLRYFLGIEMTRSKKG